MATGKFERTKPHINVGTIGHVGISSRSSYARSVLQIATIQIALANAVHSDDTRSVSLYGNDRNSDVNTDMNHSPMDDGRNRAERRADKKRRGSRSGSKYQKGRWWE